MSMTLLYEAENALEAHMLVGLLAQQDLHARIDGEFLQGGVGEIQTFGLVRILIDEEDLECAKEVIKTWEEKSDLQEIKQADTVHKTIGWFTLLICFVIGISTGVVSTIYYYDQPEFIDGVDHNGDGTLDETWHYSGDRFLRSELDRNFDGYVDMVIHNNRTGLVSYVRSDDDFNGIFETITNYKQGNPILSRVDTNADGFKNYEAIFRDGVYVKSRFIDENSGLPIKIQHYKLDVLYKDEVDTDGDGILDTVNEYDEVETKIKTYLK